MSDAFIGEIRMMGFSFAPRNWATCDGQTIPVNQNGALFALLGTAYGGDGTTNFMLPDLRGRAIMHIGPGYYRGQKGGLEGVPLTASEVGAHNHGFHCTNNNANYHVPNNRFFATTLEPVYTSKLENLSTLNPSSMTAAGGGSPHYNMQPSLVVNYCIALQGTWPNRN